MNKPKRILSMVHPSSYAGMAYLSRYWVEDPIEGADAATAPAVADRAEPEEPSRTWSLASAFRGVLAV